ncbi:MAG: hypothetical protein MUE99_10365 [Chitinophagaceae bacterium]|jgi:hypothetical protein|nr:hypothetical protein [Chitinophagaceae bacterium]
MKNVFVSAIIIASIITMAPAAMASGKKDNGKKENVNNDANLSLRYMGEDEGYLVLQLSFSQKDAKDAVVRISDNSGYELFNERVRDIQYVRYIKVLPEEISNLELVALTENGNIRKKYNLSTSTVKSVKVQEVVIK